MFLQWLVGFLGAVIGTLFDPVALVGYIVAGIAIRRWWLVALAAIGWAIVIDLLVRAMMYRNGMSYDGHLLVPRAAGAILVATIAWAIVKAIRRARTR